MGKNYGSWLAICSSALEILSPYSPRAALTKNYGMKTVKHIVHWAYRMKLDRKLFTRFIILLLHRLGYIYGLHLALNI